MRNKFINIAVVILTLFALNSKGQEALRGLQVNPKIQTLQQVHSDYNKSSKEKAEVSLPFIDDFAKSVGFPDSTKWIDQSAFVNLTYADSAPSIGVATLDAIDATGAIYPDASNLPFCADTLTSEQINLNFPGDNTIFLSFYYQPGGLGDTPDPKDTLILEFYSPDSTKWYKAWHVNFNEVDSILVESYIQGDITDTIAGDTINDLKTIFQQVIIPVNEDQYLKNNFQFRFRNYASLSSSESNESRASNSDHWHIDFVILDRNRSINDTIIKDVSIIEPMGSLLINYDAMPWHHFPRAISSEMKNSVSMLNRNLYKDPLPAPRKFEIKDLSGLTGISEFEGGGIDDIPPFSTQFFERSLDNYAFPYNPSIDSAFFEISGFINLTISPETPYRWNDTTRFYQKFYNYYAYDDGTSENGYGLIGEGTEQAMVAMRFNSFLEDTLSGIQIYFNQTLNNANQITYKIHVWNEINGKPGTILYTLENQKPVNSDSLNKFTLIGFDEILLINGPFYIGWQKVYSREMLNVGFDINRINNDKLFYNFDGEWKKSQYEGTVMIRPMFGHKISMPTNIGKNPAPEHLDINIYPNPAQYQLNINIDNQYENYTYSIFDAYGRIFSNNKINDSTIDISNMNPGIYFIRISTSNGVNTTKKFIIIR